MPAPDVTDVTGVTGVASGSAAATVAALRGTFASGITRPVGWRLAQLDALSRMLVEHRDVLEEAVRRDLGKAPLETRTTEVALLQMEVKHTRRHLRRWLRPVRSGVPLALQPASASTVLEPLGVALIIGAWNYPLLLTLSPLVGALAAGDCAVLKPSELAPATSRLLAELLPEALDRRAVVVVEGGVPETTDVLRERFDVIFYTGSGRVGRVVMAAAAEHLTPVVLELGGKCPVYVDASADLDVAADRIAWGKFTNAGQTCVAPDYLLATPAVLEQLLPKIEAAARRMYGPAPIRSQDYCRIVSERHFDRLTSLLAGHAPAFGGTADRGERRIAPTAVVVRDDTDPLLQEEVFGPVLPVVEVSGEEEAIARVAAGDKPLALYVFTASAASRRTWSEQTSSGAICFDGPLLHLAVPGIPFGGVGASGMGSYHGRRSVVAFSHEKAVFSKPTRPDTTRLLSPPFGPLGRAVVEMLAR
ncbi:aldehyde dehydrogenase (NAD+) [Quadrisphaera granulorum]|uniref:Aldehyde dehydrogenase n=1 Tax=Quadrisphaera granulorum TaxID=317664 RepID=A0A316AA23_9ACTN|nr:aldehyde dehydrogenase family protein [Quadrisphaera granulorum]PWJ53850.1 aldehyde dehydrogenase (NAD+) [Quadrisphaera granulorum]SZE96607.1 aldehyde dehydrogenase (NAD+) [Quadrisphaera granulorum]